MLNYMLSAIPVGMEDEWYYYHLLLIFIIFVLVFIIMLLRKKPILKEGQKSVKSAITTLKRARNRKQPGKAKLSMFTAKNLLLSAIYSYNQCINDGDMYNLIDKVECLQAITEHIDRIIKNHEETKNVNELLDELIVMLEKC